MASTTVGVGCGGGEKLCHRAGGFNLMNQQRQQPCISPSMVSMMTHQKKSMKGGVLTVSLMSQQPSSSSTSTSTSTSTSSSSNTMPSLPLCVTTRKQEHDQQQQAVIGQEKLDEWMRESVVEIVKNLRQAPLLLHVYGGDDKNKKKTSMKMEKAVKEEIWPEVAAQRPEGVILVERIDAGGVEAAAAEAEEVMGVMVQGRGGRVGPACYLLKTNRVGPACYFCLVRVKSFRETAKKQLEDCWLLKNLENNNNNW